MATFIYILGAILLFAICPQANALELFYGTDDGVKSLNDDQTTVSRYGKNRNGATAVATNGDYLYWAELEDKSSIIFRSKLDGSEKEAIVTTGIGSVESIAIDWFTGNIYFADGFKNRIVVCLKDGSNCTVILDEKVVDKPRAIVLNPPEGTMYWTEWGKNPKIAKAYMDGTEPSILVGDVRWPNGLALEEDRLYYTDAYRGEVASVDLDGSDKNVILCNLKHPYSVAVSEDFVYWSSWDHNDSESLNKADKSTGKHRLRLDTSTRIYSIYSYDSSRRKYGTSCQEKCTDLCLLKGENDHSCRCPHDYNSVDLSGEEYCEMSKNMIDKVMIANENSLTMLTQPSIGRPDFKSVKFDDLSIKEIVYDAQNDRMIAYDKTGDLIVIITNYDRRQPTITPSIRVGAEIRSMDLDYVTNNLYWCEEGKGIIKVLNLDNKHSATVYNVEFYRIVDFVLIPELRIMFVAMKGDNGRLDLRKIGMDGKREVYFTTPRVIIGPEVKMIYDHNNHLYISDSGMKRITAMNIQRNQLARLRQLDHYPNSMAIFENKIYWTTKNRDKLYSMDRTNYYNNAHINNIDLGFNYGSQLRLVSRDKLFKSSPFAKYYNQCNSRCSHICVQSLNNPEGQCMCPKEMVLINDAECVQEMNCGDRFKCHLSNACVDKSKMCDSNWDCPRGEDEFSCGIVRPTCIRVDHNDRHRVPPIRLQRPTQPPRRILNNELNH